MFLLILRLLLNLKPVQFIMQCNKSFPLFSLTFFCHFHLGFLDLYKSLLVSVNSYIFFYQIYRSKNIHYQYRYLIIKGSKMILVIYFQTSVVWTFKPSFISSIFVIVGPHYSQFHKFNLWSSFALFGFFSQGLTGVVFGR